MPANACWMGTSMEARKPFGKGMRLMSRASPRAASWKRYSL